MYAGRYVLHAVPAVSMRTLDRASRRRIPGVGTVSDHPVPNCHVRMAVGAMTTGVCTETAYISMACVRERANRALLSTVPPI